ncbi:hypothetical protein [Pseudoalteromonas phenolica]|uniref:hypothetical protein n=1 Tax=Pseudoalteromonas phenolica TaxID=161398 RepID=UPI000FFEE9F5|nr:hypothetical protein [Pseudoalteromonas phenolica]
MFLYFLAIFSTQAKATSIDEIKAIQNFANNEMRLTALEEIVPSNLLDQASACEYFVNFSRALSNAGRIDEAKQKLLNEIREPSFNYDHINKGRLYRELADVQYHNDDYEDSRRTIKKSDISLQKNTKFINLNWCYHKASVD